MNPPSQHADPQARREQIARGLARANFAAVIIVGVVIGLALIALAAAWRADLSARDARSATQRAGEELWQARFAQAKAERLGGGVGRRDAGLTALATAARIRLTRELRDEAIGLLALTDLEEAPRFWPYQPNLNEGTLAFDRSGHRFGWGDQQGNAWVRNIDDGQIVAQLSRRGAEVTGCTFSPDDRELAVHYNDGLVRIWNWEAKTVRVEWQGGRGLGWREGLSYSANGEYLAVHDLAAKRMRVFATTNGKEVSARMDDGDSMVFSPVDPEVLLIGSGEGVRFLRWRTGDVTRRLAVPDGNGTIRASEDGRWLAAGASTGVITLWDLQAGTTNTLVAHKDFVSDLIFGARQGLLISRSWDGTTRLWELASARSILTTRRGYAMSLSQDGERLIYMREKAGIGFWRLQRPASFRVVGSSPAENVAISSPWFSPDGRWLVASQESGLMLWDVSGRHSPIALNFENMIYGAAQFVDEGRELWAAAANGIRRWRIQWPPPDAINANAPPVVTGGEIIPGTEADEIEGLLAPAKDQIVFCRNRMEVIWLDTRSGKVIRKFGPHPGVLSVSVSPDLHWLATSGRHGARMNLWDMQTGQFVREMDARDAVVSFSPDGRWLACSLGYEITLRDTRDWQARPAFPREVTSGLPGLVAFSPDSRWLAIPQSEQELQLVDVEANAIRASFPSPNPVNFRGCTFSPDSRSIVVTAGNEVQMWNLAVLEKELDSLGMGWRQPASPTTTRTEASRTDFITTETGAMFAIIAGGNVLAAIALTFAVYRRHRQWLRDYAEVEALAAGRDRELKAAQQEILVSQKMQALGTLAAGVAHDFNNLLSVVRMANKSIRRDANGHDGISESTADIEEAVMDGKRLVQSMLGYSRDGVSAPGPYQLAEVVRDIVALLTRQFLSGLELQLDLDVSLPAAHGSRGRLRQLLLNLLVNASEAMRGQGTLRIELRRESPPREAVMILRPAPARAFARLTVADTGPGIRPEIQPRLFEPFFTTKNSGEQRGTGLGLSLVYALAEQEGIGIQVESEPGSGAAFHLFVPLTTEAATPLSVTRPSPKDEGNDNMRH